MLMSSNPDHHQQGWSHLNRSLINEITIMPPTFTPAIQQTKKYKEAHNLLALRKSASVALVSLNAKCNRTKSMKDLVHLSRNRLCLQEKIIECELHFCGLLHSLSQDDINHILFVLFDCDESGYVSIAELAEGLRKIGRASCRERVWHSV